MSAEMKNIVIDIFMQMVKLGTVFSLTPSKTNNSTLYFNNKHEQIQIINDILKKAYY